MSSFSIGIVGLPNVGKSTLFNALTRKSVLAANYPFATIDPSVGVVPVPDQRLDFLNQFSHSKKKIPAIVEFVDIAGLVKGASEGEGLGNKFLANIRETDAIAEIVRIFEDDNIIHVSNRVVPLEDVEVVNLELGMADLQTVTKRLGGIQKEVKSGKKEAAIEAAALFRVKVALEDGKFASTVLFTEPEKMFIRQIHLLTMKPILYVLNKKSQGVNLDEPRRDQRYQKLIEYIEKSGTKWVKVDAAIESELKDLEGGEKEDFRKSLGTGEDGVNNLIKAGYELLDLITFFTTGDDETRGWTIRRGASAPEAGAAIHSDFCEKFIRAEVIFWKDLLDAGSFTKARELGLVRTEGREYIVHDGDVMEFKI